VKSKPTKRELDYLRALLSAVDTEVKSSKALGMKIPKEEEKIITNLNKKFQVVI
jgi:hypothetical protein